jgi:hypothetical protein
MLNYIPDDLLLIIFSKLDNYDIIKLMQVSHQIKNIIKTDFFITYLLRRYHPMVFNSHDRFCNICNIHIYRINDKNKTFIKCKH